MRNLFLAIFAAIALSACGHKTTSAQENPVQDSLPIVYMTQEISPEALLRIYHALNVTPEGKVAVKISTGEPGGHHYLQPSLIAGLVQEVNGTIVECNTAYHGKRFENADHWQTFRDHGFTAIAPCDLMDEEGEMRLDVQDTAHLRYNLVGSHLANYDFMINLAHFKGHAMGGFGGVLKNQSIGIASRAGKAYIHTAGYTEDTEIIWAHTSDQIAFLESMAAAAQSVHAYFGNGERIVYINVVNNLSVDCDCDGNPAAPEMRDIGILASLDPVALDQACVDLVFNYPSKDDDNAAALIERINSRHGLRTIERAAEIGLGSREYNLVHIDDDLLALLDSNGYSCVVRNRGITASYTQHGVRDLLALQDSDRLSGAVMADKMVGRAAAWLLIAGKVREVYTHTVCTPAREMLENAGIVLHADNEVPYIVNKQGDGQCPLDSHLTEVTDLMAALDTIRLFYQ